MTDFTEDRLPPDDDPDFVRFATQGPLGRAAAAHVVALADGHLANGEVSVSLDRLLPALDELWADARQLARRLRKGLHRRTLSHMDWNGPLGDVALRELIASGHRLLARPDATQRLTLALADHPRPLTGDEIPVDPEHLMRLAAEAAALAKRLDQWRRGLRAVRS
jgi:hypothetical protein